MAKIQKYEELQNSFRNALANVRGMVENVVPQGANLDRLVDSAMLEIARNRVLHPNPDRGVPPVIPQSVFWAFVHAASLGLRVGQGSDEAFIVPFRHKDSNYRVATLLIGYKGLTTLAYRHPRVAIVNAQVVGKNDSFEVDLGSDPKIVYKPNLKSKGDVVGAFCVIGLVHEASGQLYKLIEYMTREDIERVRACSRSAQDPEGPWTKWFDEMARKTVMIRSLKRAPRSDELVKAMELETAFERGERPSGEVEIPFDGETGEVLTRSKGLTKRLQDRVERGEEDEGGDHD